MTSVISSSEPPWYAMKPNRLRSSTHLLDARVGEQLGEQAAVAARWRLVAGAEPRTDARATATTAPSTRPAARRPGRCSQPADAVGLAAGTSALKPPPATCLRNPVSDARSYHQ